LFRKVSSIQATSLTSKGNSIVIENNALQTELSLGVEQYSNSSSNISNKNDEYDSVTKLQTNVKVCARIRPLSNQSSKSKEHDSVFKSTSARRNLSFIPGGNYSNRRKATASSTTTTSTTTTATTTSSGSHSNQRSQGEGTFVAWDISDDSATASQSNKMEKIQGRTHSYTLDKVFGTDTSTDQIYHNSVASLVKAAMEGYHSTVLAYGQTSTGKTHTMTGTKDAPGLIPLCIQDCFKYVRENTSAEPREYLFRFSYLEVYKEHIRDLLSSTSSAPEPVRLFDGPTGLVIRGLKEEVVSSPEKVFQLLKQGEKRRQVGATHMNQHSSRSHVMVRLKIESSLAKNNKSDETRVSILSLVDLAGSESVRLNGAERRDEGQYINKSLMALGQVVLGLSDACSFSGDKKISKKHIPYRDSKLTRLLQLSLSGNAQMLLMCCISPLASYMEESHNTFKFATRAKRIEQKATIQTTKDKDETLLQTYRDEIQNLKQQLAEASQQKRQLLEEQRAYQMLKQRQEVPHPTMSTPIINNINTATTTTTTTMESTTGEIEELVEAIQTMEQLILKSRPLQQQQNSKQLTSNPAATIVESDISLSTTHSKTELDEVVDRVLKSDNPEEEGDDDLLVDDDFDGISSNVKHDSNIETTKSSDREPITPSGVHKTAASSSIQNTTNTEDQLHSELTRIRGLLGSVLQKRGVASASGECPPEFRSLGQEKVRKSLDFSTPYRDSPPSRQILDQSLSEELEAGMNIDGSIGEDYGKTSKEAEEKKAEVESLRMQLEQQERTTSLRKADSYFLQSQLQEKDKLLEEVSSLLEAVEQRQGELERENVALKRELESLREERTFG